MTLSRSTGLTTTILDGLVNVLFTMIHFIADVAVDFDVELPSLQIGGAMQKSEGSTMSL